MERIYDAFDAIGYEIRTPEKMKKSIYSSSDFQVPQERHRVIIFGVEKGGEYKLEDFYASLDSVKSAAPVKTVEDAIQKGLAELNVEREAVEIRVLEEGKKKLFGSIPAW